MRNKQAELIKQMSSKQVMQQALLSQLLLFGLGLLLSLFLFESFFLWFDLFQWDIQEYIVYGVFSGLLVVLIDIILMNTLPENLFDDGGINQKIFSERTVTEIIVICLIVAIAEETLFRGVIQTVFGYVIASIIFALVHVRYLYKPLLFLSVLLLSFYIGFLYELTNNLMVTIITHFTIDLLLAFIIRFKK